MPGRSRTPPQFLFICLIFLTSLAAAVPAARADVPSRLDLPAEPLDKALRDFALKVHRNIYYDPSTVRGLRAPAVKGTYTVSDALSLLLQGTSLHAININDDTIQVRESSKDTADSPRSDDRDHNDQPLDEIIVTGTNIRGVDNKTVPLLTFDRDAIDRSGYATMQDFIDSIPQNVKSGANSADGVLSGKGINNVENASAANLRGLGASSTLTLLNGHRVAPSSYGTGVDLTMIPLSAVERIDVLTDGSSAIYGADAVGGVINIILRKDFNGAETRARLDTLTQGGGEQKQIGQSLGHTWATGGALAVVQFEDTNAIHAQQRAVTANLPEPTDIYPASTRYSGIFSGHQTLPAAVELFADALLEHQDGYRAYNSGGADAQIQLQKHKTDSTSVNAGLRWQPFGDWHLEGDALFSQVYTLATQDLTPAMPGYTNGAPLLRNLATIKEGDIKLDGTLWSSGGSSIKAAAGASYRREAFSSLIEFLNLDRPVDRHVRAAYAEVYAPLIGPANALPLIQKLEFSAAVRHDSYSDFGAKTNPRFGLFWSPLDPIGIRAAYSTSFRAPNPIEVLTAESTNNVFVESGYPLPKGAVGNVLFFGNPTLGPETSRNLSAGVDFTPPILPGTRLSLNYYRIVYSNRLTSSPDAQDVFINPQVYGPLVKTFPSDAAVAAFVAGLEPPQTLYDFTPGGTGLAGVRYGFPYGIINATKEKTEGLDLGLHSLQSFANNNKLIVDVNATYIRDIDTTYCNSCASTDLVNTYGQPLKLRLRTGSGWSNGILSLNAAVNFANAYTDTNILPFGHVASYTTADLNAAWRIPSLPGTTLGLAVTNLFDINPPRTAPAFNSVAYDPSNADPRGRSLSLQVRQQW
jgi:iron complex outermembrane receptor protein